MQTKENNAPAATAPAAYAAPAAIKRGRPQGFRTNFHVTPEIIAANPALKRVLDHVEVKNCKTPLSPEEVAAKINNLTDKERLAWAQNPGAFMAQIAFIEATQGLGEIMDAVESDTVISISRADVANYFNAKRDRVLEALVKKDLGGDHEPGTKYKATPADLADES